MIFFVTPVLNRRETSAAASRKVCTVLVCLGAYLHESSRDGKLKSRRVGGGGGGGGGKREQDGRASTKTMRMQEKQGSQMFE
jgi:hypothetical protein